MDESCFSEPAFLPLASVLVLVNYLGERLEWLMRTPLPAKCALQFLIGHTAFLIAIRVQDIWTSMGMHGKVGRFESNVELYLSAIIRRFIERVRKLIRVWKSITIIVTTRWILERICLKMFGSFITIKIRWREIFNRDSRLFVRCFVKAVKRDRECIVFVFKQMWSNFSYRNWFRSELIMYLKFIDFINIIFTLRLLILDIIAIILVSYIYRVIWLHYI